MVDRPPPGISIRRDGMSEEIFVINIPYDAAIFDAIRAIPGRQFDWEIKYWRVPANETTTAAIREILRRFPRLAASHAVIHRVGIHRPSVPEAPPERLAQDDDRQAHQRGRLATAWARLDRRSRTYLVAMLVFGTMVIGCSSVFGYWLLTEQESDELGEASLVFGAFFVLLTIMAGICFTWRTRLFGPAIIFLLAVVTPIGHVLLFGMFLSFCVYALFWALAQVGEVVTGLFSRDRQPR